MPSFPLILTTSLQLLQLGPLIELPLDNHPEKESKEIHSQNFPHLSPKLTTTNMSMSTHHIISCFLVTTLYPFNDGTCWHINRVCNDSMFNIRMEVPVKPTLQDWNQARIQEEGGEETARTIQGARKNYPILIFLQIKFQIQHTLANSKYGWRHIWTWNTNSKYFQTPWWVVKSQSVAL